MTCPDPAPLPERPLLRLRPVQLHDWPTIHEWARRADVTQYQAWGPNRAVETRDFVVAAIVAAKERPQTRHVLTVTSADRVVGLVELTVHPSEGASAEMGYAVHPLYWGRGIATAAARLAAHFAFDELGVQRLHATCDTTNAASVRVLEKLGMHLDQTVHKHLLLGARWRDTHVFSLSADEHQAATRDSGASPPALPPGSGAARARTDTGGQHTNSTPQAVRPTVENVATAASPQQGGAR